METQEITKTLDEMILKAILVLRIHLFEMEKVNELCKDFSDRYIETLKIKLNSDNMFKSDEEYEESNELNPDGNNEEDEITPNSSEDVLNDKFYKSLFYEQNNAGRGKKNKNRSSLNSVSAKMFKIAKSNPHLKVHSTLNDKASFEISPDVCLSKISFNMLNINNNDSSYQSIGSEDENFGKIFLIQ